MTISAHDYVSNNRAPFDHALASVPVTELVTERAIFARIQNDLDTLLNTLRNAPGLISSDAGRDLRGDLAATADDPRNELLAHLDLISEAV